MAELVGFQGRGCSVALLAPPASQIWRRAQSVGVTSVPLDVTRFKFPFQAIRLAGWLRQQRVQVLNPHSSRDGWLLGVAGRLARVPFIVRTRHIDVDYPNAWLSRHAFTTLADFVLTTSDRITAHFREMFHLPSNRIATVPTGIDVARFSPVGPKARFGDGDPGLPWVGMVSVLRSWKGHAVFLQAIQQLQQAGFPARYVIVGDGPMRSAIEKDIRERGLQDQVVLAGHREDVPEVLRGLDLLLIPSLKHEGVPQIGLQALAVKTPVLGSDVGGIPEIILPGETGRIVPGGDATVMAAGIREVLADAGRTRQLAEQGRRMVETQHSLEAMLNQLDAIYRRFLTA